VAFSPDGKLIVSGSTDKTVQIWDATTGTAVGDPLQGHESCVSSVAFSPDGKQIVSGSWDKTVQIWDATTGTAVGDPLQGHEDCINSVAFSPDGKLIVSGSYDKTVRIWDATTGKAVGDPLQGHEYGVNSVAFSPDGKQIVSGSTDNTVRIWDITSGKAVGGPLRGHEYQVSSVVFPPDGKLVMSGSGNTIVQTWDASTRNTMNDLLQGHEHSISSAASLPSRNLIMSSVDCNTVRNCDASTGKAIDDPLQGHGHNVSYVTFSPDDQHIMSASDNKRIQISDVIPKQASTAVQCEQTQSILGAKDALTHLERFYTDIIHSFNHDMISEYFYAFAGFNEELIQQGVGYLQEIHLFVSGVIDEHIHSSVIESIERYCFPFPFVIFTPSCNIRLPITHQRQLSMTLLPEISSRVIRIDDTTQISQLIITAEKLQNEPDMERNDRPMGEVNGEQADSHEDLGEEGHDPEESNNPNNDSNDNTQNGFEQQEFQPGISEDIDITSKHTVNDVDLYTDHESSPPAEEDPPKVEAYNPEVDFKVTAIIHEGKENSLYGVDPTIAQKYTAIRELKIDGTFTAKQKVCLFLCSDILRYVLLIPTCYRKSVVLFIL